MSDASFEEVKACVFDAYGTLFDVHSASAHIGAELGDKAREMSVLWRRKQLEYTWLRSLMGRHEDFWKVTGDALDFAMEKVGIDDPALRARLMEMYLQLDIYPEVKDVLATLKKSGMKTAILSNGSPSMLISAAKTSGIYPLVDPIMSVEEVGIFKPHPSVYQMAVDELKVAPNQIAFLSSNGWDAHGAAAFGFVAAWINRTGEPADRLPAGPHVEIRSLSDLPPLLNI